MYNRRNRGSEMGILGMILLLMAIFMAISELIEDGTAIIALTAVLLVYYL